jgi:hypothetical protein
MEGWSICGGNMVVLLVFVGFGFCSLANPYFYAETEGENLAKNRSDITESYIPFLNNNEFEFAEYWGLIGMVLMWLGVLLPFINFVRYWWIKRTIKNSAKVTYINPKDGKLVERYAFASDDTFNKFEIKADKKGLNEETKKHMKNIMCVSNSKVMEKGGLKQWKVIKDKWEWKKGTGKGKGDREISCGPSHNVIETIPLNDRTPTTQVQTPQQTPTVVDFVELAADVEDFDEPAPDAIGTSRAEAYIEGTDPDYENEGEDEEDEVISSADEVDGGHSNAHARSGGAIPFPTNMAPTSPGRTDSGELWT